MRIVENISDLIGKTPLLKLKIRVPKWNLYLKMEMFNPSGSFKDRTALGIILDAEKKGILKKGMTIVESSSGNTAKALAMLSASRGYKFIAIVDKHAPADKLNAIRVYGGELYFCSDEDAGGKEGHLVDLRRNIAKKIANENPNIINLDQYDSPSNPISYYKTLGPEIKEQLGKIDFLVGTIGTGSSLSGTAKYLKETGKTTVIALEPQGSSHFSPKGHTYFISGPGYPKGAKIPKNINHDVIDENYFVSDSQAFNTMRFFAENKGLMFGDSGGMMLYYAMKHITESKKLTSPKNMVLIMADAGESYLSHAYNDTWMIKNELLDININKKIGKFYIF